MVLGANEVSLAHFNRYRVRCGEVYIRAVSEFDYIILPPCSSIYAS